MLRNRALFVGLATAPESKNSLEIQGFVPGRRGRRRACGFDFKSTPTWQAKIRPYPAWLAAMRARCSSSRSTAKSVDAVKADIEKFDALIAESADLRRLVRSPVFGAEERGRALAAVLAKAGIGGLAANFLMFVAANRRLFADRRRSSATSASSWRTGRAR